MPTENNASFSEPLHRPDEASFRLMFHHHPLPMWIYSLETTAFLDVNDAATHKYGYSHAEFLQMTLSDIRPAEDVARLQADLSHRRPALQQSGDWRHRLKDGTVIDVEITSHTLTYQRQPAALVIAQDVTRYKQTEAKLVKEQAFLRTLINTIPDYVWLKDVNGVYLSCNPAFERFYGASAEEIVGKTDYDFVDAALADFFRQHDLAALNGDGPHINEEWVPHAEYGREILFETIKTPMFDANGTPVGVLGIARDITNFRQAQLDLREREAKLNTLLKMLPVGISILGPDRDIVYANQTLNRIIDISPLGLARGDYLKRRYLAGDGSPLPIDQMPSDRVFDTNQPVENYEVGVEKENGTIIWTSVSAVPVPFDDWKVLIATTDITARKEAEQSLDRRLSLETLMVKISTGLGNMPVDQTRFDESLQLALAQLGEFMQADRISLVSYSAEENVMSTTHQWCAPGVAPVKDQAQQVSVRDMHWLKGFLETGQVMAVPSVTALPPAEQEAGQRWGLESVLLVPLLRQNRVTGLLSIEATQQGRIWPDAEFNILSAIGQIIATALERRQTITALQESESRFRQMAENIDDVFYLVDRTSGQLLYISPAFEKIWGRRRESLYNNARELVEAIFPADQPLRAAALARQLQGEATEIEYRVVRPDNTVRWVRDRAFPVRNPAGRVARVSGLMADVTTRKELLTDLERFNQRLQGLRAIDRAILQADDLPEPAFLAALRHLYGLIPCQEAIIYTFDAQLSRATVVAHLVEGQLQKINSDQPRLLETLHHDRIQSGQPQLVTLAEDNLLRPVDRQRFERGIRVTLLLPLKSHGQLLGKLTLLAKDPDFFVSDYVDVASEVAGQIALALHQTRLNDQIQQYTTTLEQLVAVRTAEISRVRHRLELALQAGEIGIWDWNVKSDQLVWDAQMRRLYGLLGNEPSEFSVGGWLQYLYLEDAPRVQAELEAALRGEPFDTEFRTVPPDGRHRHLKATGRVIFDDAGQPERVIGVNIDITDRKQAEQTLRRSRDQLSAANAELARLARLKDEFLANMSHELRTPLNAILGLAEILQEEVYGPLNDNQLRSMRVLEESGRHLLDLINDILDVSKMEVGKLTLELSLVNVEVLCQSSLRLIKETAQKKLLTVSTRFDDKVTFIPGDERRLKQLLVNLLSNAVKFTPAGGSIGLEVTGLAEQEMVRIDVWDSGIGIDKTDMERLFQPFIQIDSSLSRQHAGTGLGLVLVQRIAELHGGSVSISSVINQGSRFTVSLPWPGPIIEPQAVESLQGASAPQPTQLRQAMLVEDHPLDAKMVTDFLTEWGIQVAQLSHGESVVDEVASSQPDVILLDLQLPGLSGWAVLAQLKANPQTQNIPVIITSALDETAQGLALGAAGYLVKPFARQQLLDVLNRVADQPAHRAAVMVASGKPDRAPLILLAEDNEHNILTIRDFLEAQGFRLVVARNGLEAVNLASEERPDLILMDIQMPEMNGLESTRKIRTYSHLIDVPIIAVTALAMPGDRDRCLAAGANDYLTKPVSLKRLREAIMTHLNQSRNPGPKSAG